MLAMKVCYPTFQKIIRHGVLFYIPAMNVNCFLNQINYFVNKEQKYLIIAIFPKLVLIYQ